MIDVTELVGTVFSGLSALVIEDVEDAGEVICVRARTQDGAVRCPGCGTETARVHEYRERTAADVPADGRRVLVRVRVRFPQPPSSAGRVRGCRPATCQGPRSCRACGARPCPHAVEDGSRPAQAPVRFDLPDTLDGFKSVRPTCGIQLAGVGMW